MEKICMAAGIISLLFGAVLFIVCGALAAFNADLSDELKKTNIQEVVGSVFILALLLIILAAISFYKAGAGQPLF